MPSPQSGCRGFWAQGAGSWILLWGARRWALVQEKKFQQRSSSCILRIVRGGVTACMVNLCVRTDQSYMDKRTTAGAIRDGALGRRATSRKTDFARPWLMC